MLERVRSAGWILLSFGIGIAAWQLTSTYAINPHLLPPPLKVLNAGWKLIISGELAQHTWISLLRVLVGFISGSVSAIIVGVMMGRFEWVHRLTEPVIEFLRYLSPTAMIPIAIVWFGIGELTKYFLIFWGVFFIVLVNTVAGVVNVPIIRLRAATCLGAGSLYILRRVIIPSSIPYILTGMRVSLAASFYSIIAAELLAADSGLGFLLQQSRLLAQTDRIFVALVTIGVVGFLSDRMFQVLCRSALARYTRYLAH